MALTAQGPGLRLKPPKPKMVQAPSSPAGRAPQQPGGIVHGPAPAAPVTPATPAVPANPAPFDPVYEQQKALNTRTYTDTNTNLDQQQSATLRSFGLDDPGDPFSRAQLLRELYVNRNKGATNSMAARGQLYSGANQNAHDSLARGQLQDFDALRKQQDAVLEGIKRSRATAKGALEQGNIDALGDSVGRAVNTPVDPATVPPVKKKTFNQPKPKKKGIK